MVVQPSNHRRVDGRTENGRTHGESRGRDRRVNSIAPGFTETEGVLDTELIGSDEGKEFVARTPLGRIGRPDDIAPAVVFLASGDSGWVTGESIRVSGGLQ
jgi:3-oxoacyl-[acyl-carrier protein] reductase